MMHELSPTMVGFLNILNDGQPHGGTEVAESLGVSRAAIWKVVQRLKEYDVSVESGRHGYRLQHPLVLLDKSRIQKLLSVEPKVDVFEKVSSTNDYLKGIAHATSPHVCLAEHQLNGRGRLGRSWESPFGRNIYCSLSYVFQKDFSEMSGLSLAVGVLTAKAIENISSQFQPSLKWPNDIYIQGKKAGGILIDLQAEANGVCKAIIGIGLNVNMEGLSLKGIRGWTSLAEVSDQVLDRNDIVGKLLNSLIQGLETFLTEGLGPFLSDWKRLDYLNNKKISLSEGNVNYSGIVKGITPEGYLCLELPAGLRTFSYGDTHLLKH
jgi:BirA family biotin operon repressor/biotin-[acetyl-CoA-carboxylase] ligase